MDINRRNFVKAATAMFVQLGIPTGAIVKASASGTKAGSVATVNDDLLGNRAFPELAELFKAFQTPPDSNRPGGYWWWFNTLVNKKGITRDLEEFKDKGIGEVLLVNSAENTKNVPMPSGPPFLSDAWFDLYKFALSEAQRLGIKVGFNLCAGWCMGGPWIKPEESGRWYLQSQLAVTGPGKFTGRLPLPGSHDGYKNVKNPPGVKEYLNLPLAQLDYRDTAVVAIQKPKSGDGKISGERAKVLAAKANRRDASNFDPTLTIMEPTLEPWPADAGDSPIPLNSVIDLTASVGPDGTVAWDVPAGDWIIIRTGHRMTGSKIFLGLPGAQGLSIDWLNRRGVDKQFKNMGEPILAASKPYIGNTFVYFCDDSFEDGFPNWTENIVEQFKKYRGYDPIPYLPALSGFIIQSADISDRFLFDYRKTVADLMADEHYGRFAKLCHDNGVQVQNESAGPSRSGTMCMDGLKNLGRSDYPMGEFWLGKIYGQANEEDPALGYGQTRLENRQNKVTKMVASAAHIYGKKLVSTESFTATGRTPWLDSPRTLRYAADRAFCEGVNRIMIHTTTCTRPEDGKPGYEYYAGTHFNPNVTWWNQAGGFLSYLARCQYLLRQGHFIADVLYYNGDWAPNLVEPKHVDPNLGSGYDYDACNEEVLLTRLSVANGRIVLPDGMSYRLLVLPDTSKMPLGVVKKIAQLVKDGALVIGPKPASDPGLQNFPQADKQIQSLAGEVWGDCDGKTVTSHDYGKGKIHWGITPREVLAKLGVAPDFIIDDDQAYMDYIHRMSDDGDFYFVLNRKTEKQSANVKFRVASRQPFLFNPISGKTRQLSNYQTDATHTSIPLEFDPRESYFIVFPKGTKSSQPSAPRTGKNFPHYAPVFTMDGPWTVKFNPKWGGPESVQFDSLVDWSTHADERVRHYSGTATYIKHFDLEEDPAANLVLDLGSVCDIAEVSLNGTSLGTVWTHPWRIDITGLLKTRSKSHQSGINEASRPAGNYLEIKVTNTWPNRLIGDAGLSADKRLTHTNIEFQPTDPLIPSGLIGPVTIQQMNL